MPSMKQCDLYLDKLKDKGLTPQEINSVKSHFKAEFKKLEAGKASGRADELGLEIMRRRTAEFGDRVMQQALLRKRHAAVNIVVRRNLEDITARAEAEGFDIADVLDALLVGSNKVKMTGSRMSVDARAAGILNTWMGNMLYRLEDMGAAKLLSDKSFAENVQREMIKPGITGDKTAREIAQIFSETAERARQTANRFGFNIGKLEGWAPQVHDALRLIRAGEKTWVDAILPRLDLERTFPDIAGDMAAARERLQYAYKHITTGRSRQDTQLYTGGRDITAKSGAHRTLFFKDADAAVAYHAEFGHGGVHDAIVGHLQSLSRGVSLIQTFGPNPEMMITSLINAKLATLGNSPEDIKLYQRLSNSWSGGRMGSMKRFDRHFATVTGDINATANPRASQIAKLVRAQQSMAKLGGATLSAIADKFITAMAYRFRGENLFSSYTKAFTEVYWKDHGSAKGENLKTLMLLGAYSDGVLGNIAARFDSADGTPLGRMDSFTSRAMNFFFKASFLTQWTEAHKAGYMIGLAKELGMASDKPFETAFNPHMKVVMNRYGVDAARWDLWRKMAEDSGETFGVILSPERAHALPDADFLPFIREDLRSETAPKNRTQETHDAMRRNAIARERDRLETDLMSFIADETHYAVIEPDAKTRAIMTMGQQRGTAMGEGIRFMMQFKSFPIAYMQRIMDEGRWRRAADSTNFMSANNLLGITQFTMGAMVFGYIAMTAKDAVKGKEPRDPFKKETILAAAMQSGGAGILGDFLFEPVNRFGGGFVDTLAGPTAGTVGDAFRSVQNLVRGEATDAGSDALRTFLDNFPGVNLWYTRAALDYGLLFHVREMMSPGSMRRMEQRAKQVYGQDYFLPPSQIIKRGGGFK